MADVYKTFYRGQPSTSIATLYTSTSNIIIKHVSAVNMDTAVQTFALYRNGTTAAHIWTAPAMSIAAKGFMEFDGTLALEAAGTIAGVASTGSMVTLIIDGDEVS